MRNQVSRRINRAGAACVVLLCLTPLLACSPGVDYQASVDAGVQYIYGQLSEVSSQQGFLIIQSSRGLSPRLNLDTQIERVGFSTLDELVTGDDVKVWYVREGEIQRIIRIEKVPLLGC